jgi:hypothetical protein
MRKNPEMRWIVLLTVIILAMVAFLIFGCEANREYNWQVTRTNVLTAEGSKCSRTVKIVFDTAGLTIKEMRAEDNLHTFTVTVAPLDTIWLYKKIYALSKDSILYQCSQHGIPAYCPEY